MSEFREGEQHGYRCFWSRGARLGSLLAAVPELVVGRVVAVTAADSAPFNPSDDELARGWSTLGAIALSPVVASTDSLPVMEWDEWYVLDQPRAVPTLKVFVNHSGFSPLPEMPGISPTWDRAAAEATFEHESEVANRFWTQLFELGPSAYLSEGDALTCVTKSSELYERIRKVMQQGTR